MHFGAVTTGKERGDHRLVVLSQNAPQCPQTCLITAHFHALDATCSTAGIGRRAALLIMLDGASC